jgi:6,7-dimethyl-8-ribityllumazine synthase
LPNELESDGSTVGNDRHFAIVVSNFNAKITENLLSGAIQILQNSGIGDDKITVARVPGAWEIPLVAQKLARSNRFAAIVCLGCVIRGQTSHDQHINHFVSNSLGKLGLEFDLPITFGILTCESRQQAEDRSGGTKGNRGADAAEAALQMFGLMEKLENA